MPIYSEVRDELLKLDGSSVFLFKSPKTGRALVEIKKSLRSACDDAKIVGLRFHDLRHTTATRLADAGTDVFTIASILEDADLRMTAPYTHALESKKPETPEKIANFQNSGYKSLTIKKREA